MTRYSPVVALCFHTDPIINFALSSLSRRSGMASMIAEWMHRTLKDRCGVFNQSITIQQLNLDRCTGVSNLMNFKDNFDGVTRYYRQFGIRPNSEYNVTLSAITKTNIFSTSKTIQMVETGKLVGIKIEWSCLTPISLTSHA